jgi:hypothetical protein
MRYQEILEACWKGYRQAGMKDKGGRQVPNCVPVSEQEMEEDLKKWFKQKWVRFGPDGKIRGDCARGSSSEGKPKCLPQAKARALGKKGRASSAAKKRREDPNPERRGAAKNVATRVNEFVSGDGSDNEPNFNPETFYDIPKLKKVYKQLASRSVNSGWYDYQLTRLIDAMEDVYTINADVLDEMFPTAPEIANYIERNIIKAFPSENPPYIIKNPDYKPRVPRAAGPAVKENLRPGESIPLKSVIQGYTVFYNPQTRIISVTQRGINADAAIEQARISQPTMLAFRSAVDRMIGRIETETEPAINEGIPFDQCPACGGPIVHVTMLREKQDACYHKVKSRYKVWPSAYASGALVQCRKKGAANWGNKGK